MLKVALSKLVLVTEIETTPATWAAGLQEMEVVESIFKFPQGVPSMVNVRPERKFVPVIVTVLKPVV